MADRLSEFQPARRVALAQGILNDPPGAYLLEGTWGVGKTSLLSLLQQEAANRGVRVFRATVPSLAHLGEAERVAGFASLQQYFTLAEQVRLQLPARSAKRLNRLLMELERRATSHPVTVRQSIRARGNAIIVAPGAQSVETPWESHFAQIRQQTLALLTKELAKISDAVPTLILLDDLERLPGPQCSMFLAELLSRMPGATIVAATQNSQELSDQVAAMMRRHPIDRFEESEVAEFLAATTGAPPSGALVAAVVRLSARLPWAVALAADTLLRSGPEAVLRLESTSQSAPDAERRLGDTLEALFGSHPWQGLRTVLEGLSVAGDFDEELADLILTGRPPAGDGAPSVRSTSAWLAGLVASRLVEDFLYPDWDHQRFDREPLPQRWQVPPLLAGHCRRQLQQRDPQAYAMLQSLVAGHYRAKILPGPDSADADVPLARWDQFENRQWAYHLNKWVYHVAKLPRVQDLRFVRDVLTLWYLEALWWYSWYVPHWFCETLIDSCQWLRTAGQDSSWIDTLETLHRSYPRGWRHETTDEAWHQVIDAISSIRAAAAARTLPTPPAHPAVGTQIQAMASLMQGDAFGFRGDYRQALKNYDEARNWFVGDENAWAISHVDISEALVRLLEGDPAKALAIVPVLEASARESGDLELLILTFRLAGDAAWQRGLHRAALSAYLRAVLHALTYQTRQSAPPGEVVSPGGPGARELYVGMDNFPDAYTRETYMEITERVEQRVAELMQRGDHVLAADFARLCRHVFADFFDGQSADHDTLFPPAPAPEDLGREYSIYVRNARRVVEAQHALLMYPTSDDAAPLWTG